MKNFLRDNDFNVTYSLLPEVAKTTTTISIPSLSIGLITHNNPSVDLKLPGSKITFDPLIVIFKINEDMSNYNEVLKWFLDMRNPENHKTMDIMSDLTLHITTNNKNIKSKVTFIDAFPMLLSEVQFSTQGNSDSIEASISFGYTYFKIG